MVISALEFSWPWEGPDGEKKKVKGGEKKKKKKKRRGAANVKDGLGEVD